MGIQFKIVIIQIVYTREKQLKPSPMGKIEGTFALQFCLVGNGLIML